MEERGSAGATSESLGLAGEHPSQAASSQGHDPSGNRNEAPPAPNDPGVRFDPKTIWGRIVSLVKRPHDAWQDISHENSPLLDFVKFYVLPLAAVPVVCDFIWGTVLGRWTPFFRYRSPFFATLYHHIIQYGGQIGSLLALAYVLQWLAPRFQGETNLNRTTRLLAYSMSISWALGVVALTGSTSLVLLAGLLSLYGLYVFYQGVPVMTGVPPSQRVPFVVLSALSAVVVGIVTWGVVGLLTPSLEPTFTAPAPFQGKEIDMRELEEGIKSIQRSMGAQ